MRDLGEVAYYADRRKEAIDWISTHPVPFLRLTALRVAYFWITPVYGPAKGLFMAALTVGGVVGLWMLFRVRWPHAVTFLAIWLLFPLPYYFTHASPRYRYPIDWMLWLTGAYWIWHCYRQRWRKQGP